MRRVWLILVCGAAACRLNPECFGNNECASGLVCREQICVPASTESPDGGVPGCLAEAGAPLADRQAVFGDRYLFHFEEPIGADTSARNRRAATCTRCPSVACGAYGNAAFFDGAGALLSITGADFDLPRDLTFTIEAWIKPAGTATTTQCFFEAGAIALCLAADRRLLFAGQPPALSTAALSADTWHHVAAIRYADVPYVELFVDGASSGVTNLDPLDDVFDADLVIGRRFAGGIDELRFAGRALFPDVDFSIVQRPAFVAWSRGPDLWIAGERGQDARRFLRDASRPRWSPDGQKIVFQRCAGACELWIADRSGNGAKSLAGGIQPAQGAFGRAGTYYYGVRGDGCPNELFRVELESGAVEVIASEARYRDVELGVSAAPGYEVLYAANEPCAGGRFAISAMNEPSPLGTFSEVYTSTVSGYEEPRALDCDGCPEALLFLHRGRMWRGDRSGGGVELVREAAEAVDFARRAYWYYVVTDFEAGPPSIPTLHLWDYAINSWLPLTNNATVAERHVDFTWLR